MSRKDAVRRKFSGGEIRKLCIRTAVKIDFGCICRAFYAYRRGEGAKRRSVIQNAQGMPSVKKRGLALTHELPGTQELHCNGRGICNEKAPPKLCSNRSCGAAAGKQVAHKVTRP